MADLTLQEALAREIDGDDTPASELGRIEAKGRIEEFAASSPPPPNSLKPSIGVRR